MNRVQCHVQVVSHNDVYERQVLPPTPTHKTNRPQWRLTCVQMVGGDLLMQIISLCFSFILIRTSIILVHTFVCWNHIWLYSSVHWFMFGGGGTLHSLPIHLSKNVFLYYSIRLGYKYIFDKHTFQGKRIWFGLLKSKVSYYRTRTAQP